MHPMRLSPSKATRIFFEASTSCGSAIFALSTSLLNIIGCRKYDNSERTKAFRCWFSTGAAELVDKLFTAAVMPSSRSLSFIGYWAWIFSLLGNADKIDSFAGSSSSLLLPSCSCWMHASTLDRKWFRLTGSKIENLSLSLPKADNFSSAISTNSCQAPIEISFPSCGSVINACRLSSPLLLLES